jgi:hypothetical protein
MEPLRLRSRALSATCHSSAWRRPGCPRCWTTLGGGLRRTIHHQADTRADAGRPGRGGWVGVDLPGAIGVTPADGSDAVQYLLVSVVRQRLGARALHFTSRRFGGRWHFDVARPRRSRCQ